MATAITFGELQTEIGQQISRLVHVIAVDRANMQSVASSGQQYILPSNRICNIAICMDTWAN